MIHSPAPAFAKKLADGWHRTECLIAVAAFGGIATLLVLDVAGRELLSPIYKMLVIKGATGVYGAQKLSVYLLVLGSFLGIGIATATASHLLPRVGFGWVEDILGRHGLHALEAGIVNSKFAIRSRRHG